jgi:hypothetical protein
MLLTGAAIVSLFFFLSLYMQQVLGYTPLKAGLTQLPLAVVLIAAAGAAPALIAAIGRKVTLATATDRLAALTSGYQMGFLAGAAFAAAAALVTLIAVPGGKDGERA